MSIWTCSRRVARMSVRSTLTDQNAKTAASPDWTVDPHQFAWIGAGRWIAGHGHRRSNGGIFDQSPRLLKVRDPQAAAICLPRRWRADAPGQYPSDARTCYQEYCEFMNHSLFGAASLPSKGSRCSDDSLAAGVRSRTADTWQPLHSATQLLIE
jgi:hypothetical protein